MTTAPAAVPAPTTLRLRNVTLVIQDGRVVARRPDTGDHDLPERVMASAWICCRPHA